MMVGRDGQSVEHTYLLVQEIYEIVDQIDTPHDSALLQSRVLEALEKKVLIRFYNGTDDDSICNTCQIVVAMDMETWELTVVAMNTDEDRHIAEMTVEGYCIEQPDGEALLGQQWEAYVEDHLTDQEIARFLADDAVDIELLYIEQIEADNGTQSESTAPEPEPDSDPQLEPEPDSDPQLEPEPDSDPQTEPEPDSDPQPEPEPDSDPQTEPEPDSDPQPEPEPDSDPQPEPESDSDPQPEPDPQPESESGPEMEFVPEPQQTPESQPIGYPFSGLLRIGAGRPAFLPLAVTGSTPEPTEQELQTLYTAIILEKHEEILGQTQDTVELSAPASGMITGNFLISPSALSLKRDTDNFYLITKPQELDAVRTGLDLNYRLANDIDLADYRSPTSTETGGWVGIGRTYDQAFRGQFDGDGNTITGLWVENGDSANHGLFGVANGAKIYDLNVETAPAKRLYTPNWNLGVIVGYAVNNTEITNCRATIQGDGLRARYQIGGIVGKANNGVIIDGCVTIGGPLQVTGGGYVGGVVGLTNTGMEGSPNQDEAYMAAEPVIIKNSTVYGEGKLYQTSGNYTGGVVGVAFRTEIVSCTAQNVMIDAFSYGGGFAGNIYGRSRVEDCHVKGARINNRGSYSGGFAGELHFADPSYTNPNDDESYNIVKGCTVTDTKINCNSEYAGGFAGVAYERSWVQDSLVVDVEVNSNTMAGGFAGVIYGNSIIERSGVETASVASRAGDGTGGFSGKLYNYARMQDCYVLDAAVQSGGINTGGLLGQMYDSTRLSNSFAQADVVYTGNNSSSRDVKIGGLIGIQYGYSAISNCYSTGNVSIQNNVPIRGVGGLVGSQEGGLATLTNCFASGTVRAFPSSSLVGGLCGNAGFAATCITNSYFDATTTRQQQGIGNAGNDPAGVTKLTTTQMIDGASISFAYGSTADEDGTAASPWYIDPGVTYPYLYYQYNGHSSADRDYSLGAVNYSSGMSLAQSRADFTIRDTVPFAVQSAGAKWAYFPYIGPNIGPGSGPSMFGVDSSTFVSVPAGSFSHDTNPYSLGGVSATGIVAFSGAPGVSKTSDRQVWQDGQPDTYTYLGDVVNYELKAGNYSVEFDWHNPVLRDPLPDGVRLVQGSDVTLQYDNGPQTPLPLGAPGNARPYYTYDETTGVLEIYLETLYSLVSTHTPGSATIRFSTLLDQDAVTDFQPGGGWEGDNIRNRGTAIGELCEPDGTPVRTHDTQFDDRNTDPVYNKWTVTYNSNYDMDGERTANDLEEIKGYCHTDNQDDHTVLPNDDPGNNSDYLGFALEQYDFDGWYYFEDTTQIDINPGQTIQSVSQDIVLFAKWKLSGIDRNRFTVHKELVGEDGNPLNQQQQDSLPYAPYNETFRIHLTTPEPDAQTYSGVVEKAGAFTWSPELPTRLPFGEYVITEDAPTNYTLWGMSLTVGGVDQTVSADPSGNYRFTLGADIEQDKPIRLVVHNTPIGFRSSELLITKTIDSAPWDSLLAPDGPPFAVTLTGPAPAGPTYTAQVNNATGVFEFAQATPLPYILLPGEYTLTELDKDGYALDSMMLTFSEGGAANPTVDISETGQFQVSSHTGRIQIVVDNAALHPLKLRKVAAEKRDGDYVGLGGAAFELYICEDPAHTTPDAHDDAGALLFNGCWWKIDRDITSLADGLMDLGMLKPGHYALLETAAPADYAIARGYWVFTLDSSGVLQTITAQGQPPAFVALEQPDGDNVLHLVPNFEKTSLPMSGAGAYGLFAGGILCILAGMLLLNLKRRGE